MVESANLHDKALELKKSENAKGGMVDSFDISEDSDFYLEQFKRRKTEKESVFSHLQQRIPAPRHAKINSVVPFLNESLYSATQELEMDTKRHRQTEPYKSSRH